MGDAMIPIHPIIRELLKIYHFKQFSGELSSTLISKIVSLRVARKYSNSLLLSF